MDKGICFLKRERPKTANFVIKIRLVGKEKYLGGEISICQEIKNIENLFAYSCISEYSKHFYFLPNKNLHFLSGQGFPHSLDETVC